jgi:hypothetical protein
MAHNYYPDFLWRNTERLPLENIVRRIPHENSPGGYATKKVEYSHDLVANEALDFVRRNRERPFFLFWAIPHVNTEGLHVHGARRCPNRIAPGRTSHHPSYLGDVFATLGEVTGQPTGNHRVVDSENESHAAARTRK